MRKIFINKWFFLAALLTLSLSALSYIGYKKTQSVCKGAECCSQSPADTNQRTDMLWDIISRKFSSFISIQ